MRITIFTSNQPRHLGLVKKVSTIADEVWVVEECNTVFPGMLDDFYSNTSIMQQYFSEVMLSEKRIFGNISFLPSNVRQLALKDGDLRYLPVEVFADALQSDYYIVFGSSYIKGQLADFLISKNAINIHMGISPYYRGNSCNFWALYDQHPEYVGATIMKLSRELDSGDILLQVFPHPQAVTGFDLGMLAVSAAQEAIVNYLKFSDERSDFNQFSCEDSYNTRIAKRADFSDAIVSEYLNERMLSPDVIYLRCKERILSKFVNPVVC